MTHDITCACGCGRVGPHWARGLVHGCYRRLHAARRLHEYPNRPRTPEQVRDSVDAMVAARKGHTNARFEDYSEMRSWRVPVQIAAARRGISVRTAWRYENQIRTTQEEQATA